MASRPDAEAASWPHQHQQAYHHHQQQQQQQFEQPMHQEQQQQQAGMKQAEEGRNGTPAAGVATAAGGAGGGSGTPPWAWMVLACAAINVIFLGGKRRAFGVFVAQLRTEFNGTTSLAELNWIGDSYAALGYMTTAATSTAILVSGRRFRLFQLIGSLFILLACVTSSYVPNPHWLFLTHTLFHGIGSSCVLSVVGLIVNEYFDKQHRHHILATTLVSGGSIASIVFVQMYASLIETYTWRKAFLILGGIYLVVNLSGVIFFSKNSAKQDYLSSNNSCLSAIREIDKRKLPYLALWFFDRIMTSIVTYGLLLNLADYVKRRENILTRSTHLTQLFAFGEASTYAIAAVLTAFTKDLLLNRLKYILLVCTALLAAMLALWEFWASNDVLSKLLAYLCGFGLGPSITFLFPAGEELTTLPGHLAYPFSLAGMGVGMALSPFATALIAEAYEYRGFFLIQAFLIFLKLLALCAIVLLQKLVLGPGDIEYEAVTLDELNREEKEARK